jgi:hypothetical protein
MLAQLATLKARLALDPIDLTYDALLLRAIAAVSTRFDLETNRTLARTPNFMQEFDWSDREILAKCYPIELVSKFELKSSETEGLIEQPNVEYLIRCNCIISLPTSLENLQPGTFNRQHPLARVTYTGGYVLPGDSAPEPAGTGLPPTALPAELEQAAVEQTVFWFQTRDKPGVIRQWPKGGSYEQFADPDLLPSVRAVLHRHTRLRL